METPFFSTAGGCVYEPSEDSFLLLDALERDLQLIRDAKPTICLEIGVGSGIITSALSKHLTDVGSYFICTDVNPDAGLACEETFRLNGLSRCPEIVLTNLIDSMEHQLQSKVDLIVFNPPYVPTDDCEIESDDLLTKSWAGGTKGRRVIDRFIETVSTITADDGMIYLLLSQDNQPNEVIELLGKADITLDGTVIKRKCLNEHLIVLRFRKRKSQSSEPVERRTKINQRN